MERVPFFIGSSSFFIYSFSSIKTKIHSNQCFLEVSFFLLVFLFGFINVLNFQIVLLLVYVNSTKSWFSFTLSLKLQLNRGSNCTSFLWRILSPINVADFFFLWNPHVPYKKNLFCIIILLFQLQHSNISKLQHCVVRSHYHSRICPNCFYCYGICRPTDALINSWPKNILFKYNVVISTHLCSQWILLYWLFSL